MVRISNSESPGVRSPRLGFACRWSWVQLLPPHSSPLRMGPFCPSSRSILGQRPRSLRHLTEMFAFELHPDVGGHKNEGVVLLDHDTLSDPGFC